MSTNAYLYLNGSFAERVQVLHGLPKEFLEASILDSEYNKFLNSWADFNSDDPDDEDRHGCGKRLPYIGWYWRHLCFSSGTLPIGDCGDFIGFMPRNKWDHPERNLTDEEFTHVMGIIDQAMELNSKGGMLSEIHKQVDTKFEELWDYLQTLTVE